MADTTIQPNADPNGRVWDEDAIYFVLNSRSRRNILLCLARGGPRTASQLGGKLGSTIKHLVEMIDAGLVVKSPNPNDGRQPIYSLISAVPVVKTETGGVIDFGFCTIRL